MSVFRFAASLSAGCLIAASAASQFLLVTDKDDDKVWLFDAFDGSLIDDNFLPLDDLFTANTPWNAIQVGDEIWVNDQGNDRIDRFDSSGQYIGVDGGFIGPFNPESIEGGFDDTRGMTAVGNTLYVINDGTSQSAPGDDTVVTIDITTRQVTGGFALRGEGGDILQVGDELYITNRDGNSSVGNGTDDTIDVYDLAGSYLRTIVTPGDGVGLDGPWQMNLSNDGQSIFVIGDSFSDDQLIEIDLDGNLIDSVLVGFGEEISISGFRGRGIVELGNGNIFFTGDGGGINIYNRDTQILDRFFSSTDFQFVERTTIPAPGVLAIAGLAGVMGSRRRRLL